MTLFQFYKEFDTEKKCVDFLIKTRWGKGINCPHCGFNRYYITSMDKRRDKPKYKEKSIISEFKCANNKCYKKFSVTTGTVFHGVKVPLWQFFFLIFSSAINKKNESSVQSAIKLGIAQKNCWYMMMRIRMLCYQDSSLKLEGEVEVDETFLASGKWKRREKYVNGRKMPVLGLLQRGGKVVVKVIPNKKKRTVQDVILKHVECGSELFTDTAPCYFNMDSYYIHESVNHRAGEYVRGNVHTNGIESFWTKVKDCIIHTHSSVSLEHLQRYCDEVAYRWNTKHLTPMERFNDLIKRACDSKQIKTSEVILSAHNNRISKSKKQKLQHHENRI